LFLESQCRLIDAFIESYLEPKEIPNIINPNLNAFYKQSIEPIAHNAFLAFLSLSGANGYFLAISIDVLEVVDKLAVAVVYVEDAVAVVGV
jgi:hypothetical protein